MVSLQRFIPAGEGLRSEEQVACFYCTTSLLFTHPVSTTLPSRCLLCTCHGPSIPLCATPVPQVIPWLFHPGHYSVPLLCLLSESMSSLFLVCNTTPGVTYFVYLFSVCFPHQNISSTWPGLLFILCSIPVPDPCRYLINVKIKQEFILVMASGPHREMVMAIRPFGVRSSCTFWILLFETGPIRFS